MSFSHFGTPEKWVWFFVILPLRWDVSDLVPSLVNRGHPWRFGFFQRKQQMKWWQVSHLHILGGFIFLGEKFLLSTRAEMIQFWLLRISDGWLKPPTSITWIFAWLHGRKHWTKSGPHCHPLGLKWWESTSFWDTGGHIARSLSYEDPYWHTQ